MGEGIIGETFDGFDVDLVGGAGDLCTDKGTEHGERVGKWAEEKKFGTAIVFPQPFGQIREEEIVEMMKQFINTKTRLLIVS
jgi:hypothetical protein